MIITANKRIFFENTKLSFYGGIFPKYESNCFLMKMFYAKGWKYVTYCNYFLGNSEGRCVNDSRNGQDSVSFL